MYDMKTFMERVDTSGDCWLWLGAKSDGYGNVRVNGATRKAHRVAWELSHGEIADGLCVCHKCDNPQCVNPDHLFLGTSKDNARDRHIKGRSKNVFSHGHTINQGSRSARAKLKEQDIPEVRRLLGAGVTQNKIAALFGVDRSQISRIKTRSLWSHV